MRQRTLLEMHEIWNEILREFDEGGQEQFEIVQMAKSMSDNMQAMIEKLAKLTGDGIINLKAMVMTKMGDEAAMKVEHGITQPLNQCADAMARLKANLDSLVGELQNHVPSDLDQSGAMGGDPSMGGAPPGSDMEGMGDMGGEPGMDDMAGGADMGAGGAPGAAPGGPVAPAAPIAPERAMKKA